MIALAAASGAEPTIDLDKVHSVVVTRTPVAGSERIAECEAGDRTVDAFSDHCWIHRAEVRYPDRADQLAFSERGEGLVAECVGEGLEEGEVVVGHGVLSVGSCRTDYLSLRL